MDHRSVLKEWPFGEGGMAARIRAYDWAPTPLGSLEHWPHTLRTAVDIMLAMPGAATILWGPQHIQLYNDAYVTIARDRHPLLLGRPVAEGWPDAYNTVIAPLLENALSGRSTQLTTFPVLLSSPSGPEERVFDTDWVPIRDELGAVAGTLQTLSDATDRAKTQTALRQSEARHSLLIGSWVQAIWQTDADGVVISDSPSWRAYTGQTLQEWLGYGWLHAIHPDDRSYAEQQWQEATAAHGLVNAEFRLRDPNGGWRWTNVRAAPMLDANGDIEQWVGINIDIDARKRAEAALRDSEERQAFQLKLNDALASLSDPADIEAAAARLVAERLGVSWCYFNEFDDCGTHATVLGDFHRRGLTSMVGRHNLSGEQDFLDLMCSEEMLDMPDLTISEHFSAEAKAVYGALGIRSALGVPLLRSGRLAAVLLVADTSVRRWARGDTELLRGVAERTWAAIQRSRTETALGKSEERQRILVTELQHRTFNLLGLVTSMAGATVRSSASLDEFQEMFRSRIAALSRGQRLLSGLSEGDRVTFDELVRGELDAVGAFRAGDGRVTLNGPQGVALRTSTVQIFAMALHELTTNAVKYGALKQPRAHLDVCWRVETADDGQRWLHVDWVETGVLMPASNAKPSGTGQGRRLIEGALPYQLGAKTTFVVADDGIRCSIALPVSTRTLADINHAAQ